MFDNHFKHECLEIFEKLEKQRSEIFTELDSLNDAGRHFRSSPQKWNSLQIVLHLITAEKLSLIYMKRKVATEGELQKAGFKSWLRILTLRFAFNLPFKYTAPKRTDVTGQNPEYKTLKSDWNKVRSELKILIKKLDEKALKSEILKHPRVGMINMKQTLEFMEIHGAHHQKQIQGILADPTFPT